MSGHFKRLLKRADQPFYGARDVDSRVNLLPTCNGLLRKAAVKHDRAMLKHGAARATLGGACYFRHAADAGAIVYHDIQSMPSGEAKEGSALGGFIACTVAATVEARLAVHGANDRVVGEGIKSIGFVVDKDVFDGKHQRVGYFKIMEDRATSRCSPHHIEPIDWERLGFEIGDVLKITK